MKKKVVHIQTGQKPLEAFNFQVRKDSKALISPGSQVSLFNYIQKSQKVFNEECRTIPEESNPRSANKDKLEEQTQRKVKVDQNKLDRILKPTQNKSNSRSDHNQSYSFLQKFKVMKACIEYIKTEKKDSTIVTLCENLSKKFDVKYSTVREWFYQVKKDPSIVDKVANFCSNQNYAMVKGHIDEKKSGKLGCSKEQELIDWITLCHQLGILLTSSLIKEKARNLDQNPQFKATDPWLYGLYSRHNLSKRATTKQKIRNEDIVKEMIETLIDRIEFLKEKYKILPYDIINADETPMFWEYLPHHIVFPNGSKIVPSWKTSYRYKRSTILLACNSEGNMLRPTLVLKRATPYTLKCSNNINLLLQSTENGWITSMSFKEWIKEVIVPHLQGRHGILLIDSYEAHKSEDVRVFVNTNYPHIHCIVLPGGYTDLIQPLDLGVNALFKTYCKKESLLFTNSQILKYQEKNPIDTKKIQLNFVTGNYY